MKKPHIGQSEAGGSTGSATHILANKPCPDATLCRRWSADDGGDYCRLCWRDFTDPKPLRIAEGRA